MKQHRHILVRRLCKLNYVAHNSISYQEHKNKDEHTNGQK